MKLLMSVAVAAVNLVAFGLENLHIRNETYEQFAVHISASDPRARIDDQFISFVDPTILYEVSYGHGHIRGEKRYKAVFQEGYTPSPGEEPFVSFQNPNGEFKIVFFDEKYACLCSDTASEIHDDKQRREYDRSCTRGSALYEGYVRHWLAVGSYIVIYGYDNYNFPQRSVAICYAPDDSSWIKTFKELHCEDAGSWVPQSRYRPKPVISKQRWWSKLCCGCNCGD